MNVGRKRWFPEAGIIGKWMRHFAVFGVVFGIFVVLSACGGQQEKQLGIDGYVYVPQQIGGEEEEGKNLPNVWTVGYGYPQDFKVMGDNLYYAQCSVNGDAWAIKRLPLGEEFDFSQGEELISAGSVGAYTVDAEGNIYYYTQDWNSDTGYNTGGGVLCKISPDGETLYTLKLDEQVAGFRRTDSLAADGKGNVYLLAMGKILKIDKEGNLAGEVVTDENHSHQVILGREYLLETAEGDIYYVKYDNECEVWQCMGEGDLKLVKGPILEGRGISRVYRGMEGILVADRQEVLYRYRDGMAEALLCWQESNIMGSNVMEVVPISEDTILALERKNLYLLKKTPVSEQPQKEIVVLASLFPDNSLRQAVINFNLSNDKYFVKIESYGVNPFQEGDNTPEGAALRLDNAVSSSSECPDLLDLADLDVHKYAGKKALEDLSSYMEEDGFRREDFLENALKGYTINGRLVCIPKFFTFSTVVGRANQAGEGSGWTAEDYFKLLADYPGNIGAVLYYGQSDGETLIKNFFHYYYLNEYVDWEKGKCSFESQEFYNLAEQIFNHNGDGRGRNDLMGILPQDVMFKVDEIGNFVGYFSLVSAFEGDISLVGFPNTEGYPLHKANVRDCIGILSHSGNKEGAWEFIKYYLNMDEGEFISYFPTRLDLLESMAQEAVTPVGSYKDGKPVPYKDGDGEMQLKGYVFVGDVGIPYYYIPQEYVDATMDAIRQVDFTPLSEEQQAIINIVSEEMSYYLNGVKTVEEVAEIIQSRAEIAIQTGR